LPLAQDKQAGSVWQVRIIAHEADYHLTHVGFDGGELSLPAINAPLGTPLRIQIHASDVSITLAVATATSILNVLPAIITDIIDDEGQSVLRLQVGSQPLLAHITSKSAHKLALQTGMKVYVQIKGTSILN
jgi:molybdate transport system ATP-binding protein